jgi:L-threonylcarbamoyladenylate synthase
MSQVVPAFSGVALDQAVRHLVAGDLVVVPTDTVYGVAAALERPDAVERIFQAKGRPPERPIPLLVDRIEDVEQVAAEIPEAARRLMERCWPGGLTIVLPRRPTVPDIIAAGGPTIAVRMPDHPVPRALIRRLGGPLPTTSANRSGQPSAKDAEEARAALGSEVALILDAGPAPGGVDSTVLDVTQTPPVILRLGAIAAATLEAALGGPVARPRP